jgi:uncharacterized protein with beta-barrel porin domain
MSISGSLSTGSSTTTSLGGSGGAGGDGGTITVSNSGVIDAKGDLSYGVFAQSIGGGGGTAGMVVSGTLSTGLGGMASALGGSGGAGGNGGDITVTNSGMILVEGAASVGILAQSIGGGGGAGGFTGSLAVTGGSLNTQVGATGGAGGDGGDVTVTSTGSIATLADDSIAVLAQSIAGGGGQSAYAIAAQAGAFDGVNLTLGAQGEGISGKQGKVVVNLSGGMLQTAGALSYGLLAQAIGAGGGNVALSVPDPLEVGSNGLTLQLGSTGGVAGDGNVIDVTNANEVQTKGAGAIGFAAQSIGGGGGTEGVTGDVVLGSGDAVWSTVVGGSGDSAGSGAAITIANSATIVTEGDGAIGLLAQSVGGGGGVGTMALGLADGSLAGASLNVGGAQTTAGNGGDVTFTTSTGAIGTSGNLASALVVQSIGGGGGVATLSSMEGGALGDITLAAGATGGAGGDGGNITLDQKAEVVTSGTGANAVLVQSIGGGGGLATLDNTGGTGMVTNVDLGGAASGSGGNIDFALDGRVQTTGAGAAGVVVQSIGGGGGYASAVGANAQGTLTLGTSNGATGNGGDVSVAINQTITTTGAGSTALLVQSIGGGGGAASVVGADGTVQTLDVVNAGAVSTLRMARLMTLAASSGSVDAGAVDVTVGAAIRTSGANANGVVVQSVGGGGAATGSGTGVLAGSGAGNAVNLTVNADVVTSGAGSSALVAQSTGGLGGGAIVLDIGKVNVVGGLGGHAVSLLGGAANAVTNAGTLQTMDGQEGLVIYAEGGDNTIVNSGTIVGSIDLGAGVGSFTNVNGGIFLAGSLVNVGAGSFVNSGILNPGGGGVVSQLAVSGGLTLTAQSEYNLDLDLKTNTADKVVVSGAASLNGRVTTNLLNLGYARAGANDVVILEAAGGITGQDLVKLVAPTSAVATFGLDYSSANQQVIHYVIEYAPSGLTQRQAMIGNLLDRIQETPTDAFAPTAAAIISIPTVGALGTVYDSLTGEGVVAAQSAALSAIGNSHDVIDGQIVSRVGTFASAWRKEPLGNLWMAVQGGRQRLDGTDGAHDVRTSGYVVQGGWDYRPDARSVVGATFGFDPQSFSVPDVSTSGKAKVYTFGAYAGFHPGAWTLSADLLYSAANTTTVRDMWLYADGNVQAHGDFTMHAWSGRAQVARQFGSGNLVFQPFAAVEVTRLSLPGYVENQAEGQEDAALGLAFFGKDWTRTRTFAGGNVAGRIELPQGKALVTTLRAAWVHDFDPDRSVTAAFAGAPDYRFVTTGAQAAGDSGRIDLRSTLQMRKVDLQFSVGANLGKGYNDLTAMAGVRFHM